MKAAIYNPYLDTLGGGERYTLAFANVLIENGWNVDVEWKNLVIRESLESRFGMDLSGISIVPDIKRGDGYDLCFWVSDGSIPTLRSRKNILHFQVPFHNIGGNSLMNKMKLFRIDKIICNSFFTKKIIDEEFGIQSTVLYPPVDVDQLIPKRKENTILSVGRFSKLLQSKHQDILINSFKKIIDSKPKAEWNFILAGGVEVGAVGYIEKLKKMIVNYPIKIVESPDFKTLKDFYGKAKIFWSASGYGEDEIKNPEKVEHFGITVVEAMSAGAVPLVFNAGGHKEIIKNGENGYLWKNTSELIRNTKFLIENSRQLRQVAQFAKDSSEDYSVKKFEMQVVAEILK